MIRKYWPVFLTWIVVLFLYFPFLSVYFTGDDFFHFHVAQTDGSIIGFTKLFGFYSFEERLIAFYRPVFREALYNLFYSLFGLNALPFRLLQLIMHFVNISLVFVFFQRLFGNKSISAFTTFFYGITAAQVGSLYYLAGGIQAQGATMFMLFALVWFQEYLKTKSGWSKFFSHAFFIFSLASHELGVITIVLMAGLFILDVGELTKNNLINFIKEFWIIILVTVFYLYLNFFIIGFSESEAQYKPSLSPFRTANTLMWYGLWSLGVPEMLVDFVAPGFRLLPSLMKYWGNYFKVIFSAVAGAIGLMVGMGVYLLAKKKKVYLDKQFWLLLVWFPLALLPVVFLPLHKKTYYLATALPAFWGIVGYLVVNFSESVNRKDMAKVFVGLFVALLLVLSVFSINLSDETYWAAKRGRLAKKLVNDITNKYPKLPKGAVVLIKNDPEYPDISGDWGGSSTQASYMLNGSDALQLVYDDFELEVKYEDVDGEAADGIFEIIAVID